MLVAYDKNGNKKNIADYNKVSVSDLSDVNVDYVYGYIIRVNDSGTLFDVFTRYIDSLNVDTYTVFDIIFEYSGRHHVIGYMYGGSNLYGGFILHSYNHLIYEIGKDEGVWSIRSIVLQQQT